MHPSTSSGEMSSFKIVSLSDIHFGHPHVTPYELHDRLVTYVYPQLMTSKFCIIGGDIFDTSLSLTDKICHVVIESLVHLIKTATDHGVIVRIMRGTYSHDRTQLNILPVLYRQMGGDPMLFNYIDTIQVEEIESLGIRVVYIPDDLPYKSATECLRAVKMIVGDQQIDYAFTHGYFEHTLPPGAHHRPKIVFTAEDFAFVDRLVISGHVHTRSAHQHVVYNGSFDRLNHGEEEPKGFLVIDHGVSSSTVKFIENKAATAFTTLDLRSAKDPASYCLQWIHTHIDPDRRSHLRLVHDDPHVRKSLQSLIREEYSWIRCTVLSPKSIRVDTSDPVVAPTTTFSTIDPKDLPELIHTYLQEKYTTPPLTIPQIRSYLKGSRS